MPDTTPFDENWPRWIRASAYKFFNDNLDPSIPRYMEGDVRKTSDLSAYIEFRVNGPHFKEITAFNWLIDLQINVAIMCGFDKDDLYKVDRFIGKVIAAMPIVFPIMKSGDAPLVQLGCMQREIKKGAQPVKVYRFGNVDPKIKLSVVQVEADFRMSLP